MQSQFSLKWKPLYGSETLFVLTLTRQEHAQCTQDFKLHKGRLGREQGKNNIQTAAFNKFCLVSRYRNKKNILLFHEIINCAQKKQRMKVPYGY